MQVQTLLFGTSDNIPKDVQIGGRRWRFMRYYKIFSVVTIVFPSETATTMSMFAETELVHSESFVNNPYNCCFVLGLGNHNYKTLQLESQNILKCTFSLD